MGLGTVHEYLERAAAAGIGWLLFEGWSEEELEAKLFGNQPERAKAVQQRPQPDWKAIHEPTAPKTVAAERQLVSHHFILCSALNFL
jgi:transposase